MIDPKSRSREWILESCEKNKVKDPTLMEKTIRAFSLLEALTKSGCDSADGIYQSCLVGKPL